MEYNKMLKTDLVKLVQHLDDRHEKDKQAITYLQKDLGISIDLNEQVVNSIQSFTSKAGKPRRNFLW